MERTSQAPPPYGDAGHASPRLPAVVDELVAQWHETRSLLRLAVSHLQRLLHARPWQGEVDELRRRIQALERERDALWQEVWQLRHRLEEEAALISLPQRVAMARDELAALGQELHRLARAIDRITPSLDGDGVGERAGVREEACAWGEA